MYGTLLVVGLGCPHSSETSGLGRMPARRLTLHVAWFVGTALFERYDVVDRIAAKGQSVPGRRGREAAWSSKRVAFGEPARESLRKA